MIRRERIGRAAAVVTVVAAAAAPLLSCRGQRPPPGGGAETMLRIGQVTSGVTLDPHRHDSHYTYLTLGQMYEKLVTLGPGLEIQPELAVRWENPSERVWRFHLRPGVAFHDGRPFGAEDVIASLQRARRPDSHIRHYLQAIEDARKVDDLTVDVVTNRPAPILLNSLVFVMIVPRSAGAATITQPIGTGPYAFVSGSPGGTIVCRASERWRGSAPDFRTLSIVPLAEPANRAGAIASGRADVVAQFPPGAFAKARADGSLRLVSRPGDAVDFLMFSMAKGSPFADARVRRAVALAIDKDDLVKSALLGLGTRADQIVPRLAFGYSASLPPLARDVPAARRLLAEAGAAGLKADILLSTRVEALGSALQRQLAEAGVTLRPVVLTPSEFYERTSRAPVALALHTYGTTSGDAWNSLAAMLHTRGDGYGTFNLTSYSSAALDRLIDRADQELEPEMRRRTLESAMGVVNDDLPVVPLTVAHELYGLRRELVWTPAAYRLRALDVHRAAPSR